MTFRQAEEYLLGLELFGMRFGLDRMHKLMTVLGLPQRRFASIHVVGTNGKSSTVRFCAAMLERHGVRTGSYTSPHLRSFRERIEVGEGPISEADFAAAVSRAAHAAELVNRTQAPDDQVTQFEALTAAAYHELARRGVEVAVVEAGLGGRYDATNVIPSQGAGAHRRRARAHALARAHASPTSPRRSWPWCATRARSWPARSTPSRGAWPSGWPRERHATLVRRRPDAAPALPLRAAGASSARNFALAAAAAEAFLGRPLDPAAVAAAARRDAGARAARRGRRSAR